MNKAETNLIIAQIDELGLKIAKTRTADLVVACGYAKEVYALASSIQYTRGIAEAEVMFAVEAYFGKGDSKQAIKYLDDALVVLENTDSYALTCLYTIYGNIYWRMGDFEVGFYYIQKGLEKAREHQDDISISWTAYLLAGFCLEMKQFENAKNAYQEALLIFEKIKDLEGYTSTLCGLGKSLLPAKTTKKPLPTIIKPCLSPSQKPSLP